MHFDEYGASESLQLKSSVTLTDWKELFNPEFLVQMEEAEESFHGAE